MNEEMKKTLKEIFIAAQPEIGKRFAKLLSEYIENCETETERMLLEHIIRNKIDRESKAMIFRIINRLITKFL